MSKLVLDFAEPFFKVKFLRDEQLYRVDAKSILLNLSELPIKIESQRLEFLQSVLVAEIELQQLDTALLIEQTDNDDEQHLFEKIRNTWPLAYDVRKEERLWNVSHYMSPKTRVGKVGLSMYHCGSVPLNVGLHKTHPHCPDADFKEVHTQIVGYGKMQQCRTQDIRTLYLEEPMAPGMTHKPMYDQNGDYPWHQYETITPGIIMAIEIFPSGNTAV